MPWTIQKFIWENCYGATAGTHNLRFWITNLGVADIVVNQQRLKAKKLIGLIDALLAQAN